MNMKRFQDKIALITGSASGIGKATASALAKEGATIILNDINQDALQETAEELQQSGASVFCAPADVMDSSSVKEMVTKIESQYDHIDILINNAGTNVRADIRHIEDKQIDNVLGVNLNSTIYCTRDAFSLLKNSKNASVINLSSVLGSLNMRQASVYSAAKAAIEALTRSMAIEFAPFNIRVNFIAPGFVETKLTERFTKNPHVGKALLEQTPLHRFGLPEEIAAAALFLSSSEASYITGAGLAVDGGMSARLV